MEELTNLEQSLLDGIKETWGSTGCDNTYLDDAANAVGMSMKVARGVVSSLIKKGVVLECLAEYDHEINLTEQGLNLIN